MNNRDRVCGSATARNERSSVNAGGAADLPAVIVRTTVFYAFAQRPQRGRNKWRILPEISQNK